ncbi:MAG: prepilin-type N-terminal cleavage/methylation domain-containing protein [Paracoccaceae bacterium]
MPFERASPSAGVSLVELLVVIALLALVTGVVGVRLTAGAERSAARGDAAAVLSAIRDARLDAMRSGRIVVLDLERIAARLAPGTTLAGPERLALRPEGGGTGATLVLRRGDIAYRLRIDGFTGAVTLEETE